MAIRYARAFEPYGLLWFEEPCPSEDLQGIAEVRRATTIPIATGERLVGRAQFRELFERRAADVVQPDISHCGGLWEARKIAAAAETCSMAVAPHNPNGPIGSMVSVHLALALPNVLILEQVRTDVPWRNEIVDAPIETVGGYVEAPTRPGIGVELVEEVAAAHPGKSPPPHLHAAPDGSFLDW
jgi:galactonate dehydratase